MMNMIVLFIFVLLVVQSSTSSIANNNIAEQANSNLLKTCMTESDDDNVDEVKAALEKVRLDDIFFCISFFLQFN